MWRKYDLGMVEYAYYAAVQHANDEAVSGNKEGLL